MRALVQRVREANLVIDGETVGEIGKGLVVFVGFSENDDKKDMDYIIDKTTGLRIFEDDDEKMNLSVQDISGEIMFIPNFTLYGDVRRGKRPSFSSGASIKKAKNLYDDFVKEAKELFGNEKLSFGVFQADMKILVDNDGPVNILLDSEKLF